MWVFIHILCLVSFAFSKQTVLNFSLLSQAETVSLSLASYLEAPKLATLDKVHSKNIDALVTELTTSQPLLAVSAVPLRLKLPNGTEYSFSGQDVLETRSIFNQPNKLFLLKGNIILSVRYQFSPSDAPYSVAVAVVEGGGECTELDVIQNYGNYYAIVGCLRSENEAMVYGFRFSSTDPSIVNGLTLLPIPLRINLASCVRLQTYSFREFVLAQNSYNIYNNSVLFYCAEGMRKGEPSSLYFVSVGIFKGSEALKAVTPNQFLAARRLKECLAGSDWVGKYEQGLLILRNQQMSYFHGQQCDDVLDVTGVQFVDGVEEQDVQYIYVMFSDKMYIKESYSPNFQTVTLHHYNNLTLHSYGIARRFLTLLFDNATHQSLTVYDLVRGAYPTQIDQLLWPKTKEQLTIFPVANFLDNGNYFLSFDALTGDLVLNYYQGYMFTFSVKNPITKLPSHVTVNISNTENQNLVLECEIRAFNDSSIVKAPLAPPLHQYHDLLSIDLSEQVQGPLGRFYNYPNNISAFQYINEFSQMDLAPFLKMNGRPLAISFNNDLNAAVINFYYSALTKTCELDFDIETKGISLADCKTLTRRKSQIDTPMQVVVLSQDKYLQYNTSILQYCALSSNNQFECMGLGANITVGVLGFGRVRLVKYFYTKDADEVIQLVVYNHAEVIFCCLQRNAYLRAQFNFNLHFHATSSNLPDLASWAVRRVLFDPGYTQFMVLHLAHGTAHRVVVYAKPPSIKSGSTFIGHVMQKLEFAQLSGVFSIGNLLVCVSPSGNGWLLQEYKITKYFRVKETRQYPLYHLSLAINGTHRQDGDYIYLEALENDKQVYAVYSPLQSSSGVLSHKFAKEAGQIIFAQQLGQVSGNSMGLNGGRLFGLVSPQLTFKFLAASAQGVQMGKYDFQVGVIDTNGMMTILPYEFQYNEGQESIKYDGPMQLDLQFDDETRQAEFQIDPEKVHGPVNDYQLILPNDNSCGFFAVQARDVFTKEGCLAYLNPAQYGSLTDFLALERQGITLQLLVTELSLMCVLDRRITRSAGIRIDLNGLANCKFEQSQEDIFMLCDNATSIGKLIYVVTVGIGGLGCTVGIQPVALPNWFSYAQYNFKVSGEWLILQVPIRYRQNCIYYKTTIMDGRMGETYSLLINRTSSESEFQARDKSISPQLFFILDKGLGIYNLSDTAKEIGPALWLTQQNLSTALRDNGELVYLKFISLSQEADLQRMSITMEVGTEQSAYQVVIDVVQVDSEEEGQTRYRSMGVLEVYQYRQYTSCRNNLQSKSQNFNSLTIKVCSYEPPDQLVFANFVSISNDTPRALIQFYNRSGTGSYPFRTDTIYSNSLSHHSFLIRHDTLIVASLFNLLCYYALASSLRWQLRIDPYHASIDRHCQGSLVIYNLQFRTELKVSISYDQDGDVNDYWTNGVFYLQRAVLLVLLVNCIRLLYRARSKGKTKLRKRFSTRVHTNRFEVMVKINSKISS